MSEPIADRLKRFTPDATGLDRDALLFAAGSASVRRRRWWPALCGVLAASQVFTLALLYWPQPAKLPASQLAAPAANAPGTPAPDTSPPGAVASAAEEQTGLQLREQALAREGNLPSGGFVEQSIASEQPLTALSRPESLLH
jgi:hypothetical protein